MILNYKLGLEKIDKSLDIANIISKLRQLNFFMKMMIPQSQRRLLKLRVSKFIPSDLEYEKSIFKQKKCVDTQRMLDEIVDSIRMKKIESQDLSLLKVAGLEDIIEILKIKEQY